MMADINNKQLNMFMTLTSSLVSNDGSKKRKRINLCHKITAMVMNNPKFSNYLHMTSTMSITQQLSSIQCQICQRCIQLLQHIDIEIHIFAKSLFYKLTDNNETLTNIVLVLVFNSYSDIMPKSLLILTNNHTKQEIEQEMDILGTLRGLTVIIDRLHELFKRKNTLKTRYLQQMLALQTAFKILMFSLYSKPSSNHNVSIQSQFSSEPYKLPSLEIQLILIEFWSKYPLLLPNDVYFRTLYLLRWLCRIPSDFNTKNNIINLLLNIITSNFNTSDLKSDSSETVVTLYSLLGFLGGSPISTCDENKKNKTSAMTFRLMERMPLTLKDNLSKNMNEMIRNLGVDKFAAIICGMLSWPQNDNIYPWILEILQQLEKNGYFNLLCNIAIINVDKLANQLAEMNERDNLSGALMITQYLLYGIRRTPQGFHNALNGLVKSIKVLCLLNENNDSLFYNALHDIVELCHILLFRWPGYPSLYYNLSQLLHAKKYREPDESRIRYILQKYEWRATTANKKAKHINDSNYKTSSYISSRLRLSTAYSNYNKAKRSTITDKAGLTNLGATCYMNSIVQCLYLSDDFRTQLLSFSSLNYDNNNKVNENKWSKMKHITQEIQHIFGHLKFTRRQAVSTKKLVDLLPSPWTAGRQHDASEFAKYLIDCIWSTIQYSNAHAVQRVKIKTDPDDSASYSKIDPYFGGLQRNNIKCGTCHNISSKLEPFTEIALSLSMHKDDEALCTIKMMKEHFGIEVLEGDNKYFCSKCNGKVVAERYTEIVQAPKHLIICFKRFSWNYTTMRRIKKNDWVNCPLSLDLSIHDKDEGEMKFDNDEDGDKVTYQLYSAVVHSGKSAEYGHYYTIGRHSENSYNDKSKWYMFNDRSVSISDYDKLCEVSNYYRNDVPYLLFYKRVDQKAEHVMMDNVEESKWKNKVDEDNKMFEKQLNSN